MIRFITYICDSIKTRNIFKLNNNWWKIVFCVRCKKVAPLTELWILFHLLSWDCCSAEHSISSSYRDIQLKHINWLLKNRKLFWDIETEEEISKFHLLSQYSSWEQHYNSQRWLFTIHFVHVARSVLEQLWLVLFQW